MASIKPDQVARDGLDCLAPDAGPWPTLADLGRGLRRWLASGRCQSSSGAFCAWRSADSGQLAFEYPEISGYALTAFGGRARMSVAEECAARRAATWLTRRLQSGDRSAHAGWDAGAVYNFDLAMIATGLIRIGARLGEPGWVDHGLALTGELQAQIDALRSLPALAPGAKTARAPSWSTAGRAHMLKATQCLLLAGALGQPGAEDAAAALVEQSVRLQREDGRFLTQPRADRTMLHPHLYAIEGLWIWGTAQDDAQALARARAALRWVWRWQLATGGFPRSVPAQPGAGLVEQSDLTCQAVRLALTLDPALPRLHDALTRIRQLARSDGDAGLALVYQPEAPEVHLNAWVSLFGAQAIDLAMPGRRRLSWETLI